MWKMLPKKLKLYFQMDKRQRKREKKITIWVKPFFFMLITCFIAFIPIFVDGWLDLSKVAPSFLVSRGTNAQTFVSILVSGTLLIAAYTLNSILVVLTTFSSDFTPRMLIDFIADRKTQSILGIFNGGFVFTLLCFLFITNSTNKYFVAVPISCILVTLIVIIVFTIFINHTITWLQVHNIADRMKNNSQYLIRSTLLSELEPYRADQMNSYFEMEEKQIVMAKYLVM